MCPLTGDWDKAQRKLNEMAAKAKGGALTGIAAAARELERAWKTGLTSASLGLAPNSPITIASKSSSKPLIDHGGTGMVGSIRSQQVVGFPIYFVGINRGARGKNGESLTDIAAFHEKGGVIRAKGAKALAIPMTRKAKRAGSPRNYPGQLLFLKATNKKKPWIIGVFIDKTGSRQRDRGVDGKFQRARASRVAYLLMTRVRIPPRPHRRLAYEKWKATNPQGRISKHIAVALKD